MTEASDVFSLGAMLYTCIEGQPPFGMEDNALAMLHKVAGGQILPPRRAGSLTEPLVRMLAADPADRPQMPEVRDALAKLAAGPDGDTTTVLLARTDVGSGRARPRTGHRRSPRPMPPRRRAAAAPRVRRRPRRPRGTAAGAAAAADAPPAARAGAGDAPSGCWPGSSRRSWPA